jgi:betaine-aldehyde dehydrogenase
LRRADALSPLTALRLGNWRMKLAFPPACCRSSPVRERNRDALVEHPLVRKVSFTGSTEIGSRIMALAARGIKRVSLELGGKSPNIIFADADLEKAASTSPMSVFANAGQDCCARSRVFVERPVFDRFVEKFIEAMRAQSRPAAEPDADRAARFAPASETVEGLSRYREATREIIGGERIDARIFLRPASRARLRTDRHGLARGDLRTGRLHPPVRRRDGDAARSERLALRPERLVWTNDLKRAARGSGASKRRAQASTRIRACMSRRLQRLQAKRDRPRPRHECPRKVIPN